MNAYECELQKQGSRKATALASVLAGVPIVAFGLSGCFPLLGWGTPDSAFSGTQMESISSATGGSGSEASTSAASTSAATKGSTSLSTYGSTSSEPTTGGSSESSTGATDATVSSGETTTTSGDTESPVSCHLDVLIAVDGSASMSKWRNELRDDISAFINVLRALYGAEGSVRVGLIHDHDGGYINPDCWKSVTPWVDSTMSAPFEMSADLGCALEAFDVDDLKASPGCEHPLSSAVDLLDPDSDGFLREDAILVLLVLTDVDDYGEYDLLGGNICEGCDASPEGVESLTDRLIEAKGGDPSSVRTVIVAGDPDGSAETDPCERPGSCGCSMFECKVYDAPRLLNFAQGLEEAGSFVDLCDVDGGGLIDELEAALSLVVEPACVER